MGKEYQRQCPDCNSIDFTLFVNRGDGRCSHCDGDGRTTDVVRALAGPILGFDTDEPCKFCSGTGQCQTCGGTGYQYYYEENYNDDITEETSANYNDTSYSDYSFDDSHYSSSSKNSSVEDGDNPIASIIGFLVLLIIIIAIFNILTTTQSNQPQQSYNQQQEQPIAQPQVAPCESKESGDYSFKNTTSRTIYIFVFPSGYIWSKVIEVEPYKTVYEYNMPAIRYDYKYSYYRTSNFNNNDVAGEIEVEKCQSKSIELALPPSNWYTLSFDAWKEIDIPAGCCYAVVLPYNNFSIRFSKEDREHFGNSYAFIPEGTTRIYLKSNYPDDLEVSIQKFKPWRESLNQ